MINPATQLFMAQRMGARIRSEKVDHTPLVTAPEPVIEVILEAVASFGSVINRSDGAQHARRDPTRRF